MNDIKLYVNNEFMRTCSDLFDAAEWAIGYALEGYAVKVVCNGETILDWGKGYLKAVYDKEVNE